MQAADVLSESPALSASVLAPLLQRALASAAPRPGVAAGVPDAYVLFHQHGGTLRRFLADWQRRCRLSDAELRRLAGRAG